MVWGALHARPLGSVLHRTCPHPYSAHFLAQCLLIAVLSVSLPHLGSGLPQPSLPLPRRSCDPHRHHPFVFFELHHTSGSDITMRLFQGLPSLGLLGEIVPCKDTGEEWRPHYRRDWNHKILAGCIPWSHVFESLPFRQPYPAIRCMTVIRRPLKRLLDCLQQTGTDLGALKAMTTAQLDALLLSSGTQGGVGCQNEVIRVFSGFGSDREINQLANNTRLGKELLELSKENMANCLIIPEDKLGSPEMVRMLAYWHPWLNLEGAMGHRVTNESSVLSVTKLTRDHKQMFIKHLALEVELFEFALKRYAAQAKHVASVSSTACEGDGSLPAK